MSEVTSPTVDDDELLALCMQIGDDKGNLKFLVQQSLTSPPSHGNQAMAPPPPLSATASPSPRRRMKDLPSQTHGKSDSLSSSSSFTGTGGLGRRGDPDGGSGLHRSRAHARRPGTAGQSVSESSPIESNHAFSDTRNADQSHSGKEIMSSSAERRPSDLGSPSFRNVATTSPPPFGHSNSSTGQSSPSAGTRPLARPVTSQAISSSRNGGWSQSSQSSPRPIESSSGRPAVYRSASQQMDEDQPMPYSASAAQFPGNVSSSHDRIRSEELGLLRNDNLSPQSRHASAYGNRQSVSSSGSGEAPSIHNARSLEDMRRADDGIGSPRDSSARRPSQGSSVGAPDLFSVHPLDQRDGRYPTAAVSRGSGSTGSSSAQGVPSSLVPGPGASGSKPAPQSLGAQILRQSSADSPSLRGNGPPPPLHPLPSSGHDPRMVASPASLGGRSLQSPPIRYASAAAEMYQGSPQMTPSYGPRPDPGFNHQSVDPRINAYARPPPARPPMAASGGSFGYQQQQLHYDPHVGPNPPPLMPYTNEFGARVTPIRPVGNNGFGSPFPSRPHTYHDGHQQISYRPHPQSHQGQQQHIQYQQQQQQQHQQHQRPFQNQMGPQQGGMAMQVHNREDPFTAAMFPASSARQVSQFQSQRVGAVSLSPGMTVQESLSTRHASQGQQPQVQGQGQSAHPFGPRDPRELRRPQSDYERYERTPLAGGRPETFARPQYQAQPSQHQGHPHPHASPSANSNLQSFEQQQQQRAGQGQGMVQASTHTSGRSSGSSFTSSSSHRRNFSNEDKSVLGSTEESAGSAPTSARSSRSGPISPDGSRRSEAKQNASNNHQKTIQRSSGDSEKYYGQEQESREDLEDIDLLNIRPLPRPPQQGGGSSETPRLETPDPMNKAGEDPSNNPHWGALFNVLSKDKNAAQGGTSSSGGDTLRAAPRSDSLAHSEGSSSTAMPSSRSEYDVGGPADGGTFASFQSFDDDDDETGTWAQPLQPDVSSAPVGLKNKAGAEEDRLDRTLGPGDAISLQDPGVTLGPNSRLLTSSPRRPELRLTIETPGGSKSRSRATSPIPQTGSASASVSKFANPTPSPGINRRTSFARRESDWAFRPPPEQLYENLDDFFPKHDLDKPVLDASAAPGSPLLGSPKPEESSPSHTIQPLSAASAAPGVFPSRSRHKKSIRIVAQDRKNFLEQSEKRRAQGATQGGGLARRRSTKLWGSKVLEMTPGQDQLTPSSLVSDSPSSDSGARRE